ncbi:SDH family Clp fold serine proteinase [Limimaricola sp. AA108-03]|uniref:SDH family Clp fold serine proteinase n=1 Tax=Limimaricola sp. AA108-03 TaxID=3425945 RepID=UPI003D76E310
MSEAPNRKLRNQFPRSLALPSQSSKFWAKEKDRYIRQLLIADIEEITGREAVVYFARLSEGINHSDPDDLSEVIDGIETDDIDLIIQTPGGSVDAVEKFVTVLRQRVKSYRVIVPSLAKSGGTVIAMSSEKILFGVTSELGPIDPQFVLPELGPVPCQFIADDQTQPPILRSMAKSAVDRMGQLAEKILSEGMLKDKDPAAIKEVIQKISSSDTYNSHGAVIDFSEAQELGLSVEWLDPNGDLWRRIWLLNCCYDHDVKVSGVGKILEGGNNSIARPVSYSY